MGKKVIDPLNEALIQTQALNRDQTVVVLHGTECMNGLFRVSSLITSMLAAPVFSDIARCIFVVHIQPKHDSI